MEELTIDFEDLTKLLSDESTREATLQTYFEQTEGSPMSSSSGLTLKMGVVVTQTESTTTEEGFEGFVRKGARNEAIDYANNIAKKGRNSIYNRIKNESERIKIVSEGDSWFNYPDFKFFKLRIRRGIKETIDHLIEDERFAVYSLDSAADLLRNMYHSREYLTKIYEEKPRFFLLSAGGNDFFEIFPKLLKPKSAGEGVSGWMGRNFRVELESLKAYYLDMFLELTQEFPNLDILIHGYDYILPREDGEWIGKPMLDMKINSDQERRDIMVYVVDTFNDLLEDITSRPEFNGRVHHVDVRNSVVPDPANWFDEIHPNSDSFAEVAKKFKKKMDEILA